MGLGQFMPSSWARFAWTLTATAASTCSGAPPDAIGSVANYFKGHGWTHRHAHALHRAIRPRHGEDWTNLLAPDILPTFSATSMQAKGALLDAAGAQHAGPLALVELENGGDTPTYVAGTENFYAITRYNWSSYYAMAVIELGRESGRRTQRDFGLQPLTRHEGGARRLPGSTAIKAAACCSCAAAAPWPQESAAPRGSRSPSLPHQT